MPRASQTRPLADPRLLGIAEAVRHQLGGDLRLWRRVLHYLEKAPHLRYKEILEIVAGWEDVNGTDVVTPLSLPFAL